jgi:hypothetical protein
MSEPGGYRYAAVPKSVQNCAVARDDHYSGEAEQDPIQVLEPGVEALVGPVLPK